MSKILVTGATGRLGANVVKQLVERGDDVRALILPSDARSSDTNRSVRLKISLIPHSPIKPVNPRM